MRHMIEEQQRKRRPTPQELRREAEEADLHLRAAIKAYEQEERDNRPERLAELQAWEVAARERVMEARLALGKLTEEWERARKAVRVAGATPERRAENLALARADMERELKRANEAWARVTGGAA